MLERSLNLTRPLSLRLTLGGLGQGACDPCVQFDGDYLWWATRTADGPATICLSHLNEATLKARAWGPGASNLLERLPFICGEHQDDGSFTSPDPLIAQLHHDLPGLRIPKTGNVWEMCFAVVLAQSVTGAEAIRSHRNITLNLSDPAPGPRPMLLPVSAERVSSMPYWWFHRFGVERKRADILRHCARYAGRLDALSAEPTDVARKQMLSIPGLGRWTAASVALVALGDQDAVPVGDYHFADHVSFAMANETRGTDQRMLELLEPFRGRRGRVLRLLLSGTSGAPKFGPRYSPIQIAAL